MRSHLIPKGNTEFCSATVAIVGPAVLQISNRGRSASLTPTRDTQLACFKHLQLISRLRRSITLEQIAELEGGPEGIKPSLSQTLLSPQISRDFPVGISNPIHPPPPMCGLPRLHSIPNLSRILHTLSS